MAGIVEDDWKELCKLTNEAGFPILELNLSCPHGMTESGMGRACGEVPEAVERITAWVKKYANPEVKVFVKLTPNHGDIPTLGLAIQRGGGDGITAINTFPTLMDPKPDGTPWPKVGEKNHTAIGGGAGAFIRPIAMRKISELYTHPDIKIPIMGCGGVTSSDHLISMIRYGASVVQVCGAVQEQDYSLANDYLTGLKAHM